MALYRGLFVVFHSVMSRQGEIASYEGQLQRIRTKLERARKADRKLKVFGAKSHAYRIGGPASEREIGAFEERYALVLPGCYRAFLAGVGNGGLLNKGSAAGPFYGVYPLGGSLDEIVSAPESYLSRPAILDPDMTDEEWSGLTQRINAQDDMPEESYQEALGRIFSGLLPIGSQGCSYLHALVLNGPHAGRVVNLDLELQKPKFAFERNFLDWYERWLDEVIAGYLQQDGPTWFGYTMGGDAEHLLRVYAEAEDRPTRLAALKGLAKLTGATGASCQRLCELCGDGDADVRHQSLQMLTKLAYPLARDPLCAHILGDDPDCLVACQSIRWFAEAQSREWVDLLKSRLPTVTTPETFRFISYLLTSARVDFREEFRPFCTHSNEEIRVTALFSSAGSRPRRP